MKDLTLDIAEGKLNIRVAAWIEHGDQILVSTFPDGSISLVGGRLKFSETTLEGIQREVLEEQESILMHLYFLRLLKISSMIPLWEDIFTNFFIFIKAVFKRKLVILMM